MPLSNSIQQDVLSSNIAVGDDRCLATKQPPLITITCVCLLWTELLVLMYVPYICSRGKDSID